MIRSAHIRFLIGASTVVALLLRTPRGSLAFVPHTLTTASRRSWRIHRTNVSPKDGMSMTQKGIGFDSSSVAPNTNSSNEICLSPPQRTNLLQNFVAGTQKTNELFVPILRQAVLFGLSISLALLAFPMLVSCLGWPTVGVQMCRRTLSGVVALGGVASVVMLPINVSLVCLGFVGALALVGTGVQMFVWKDVWDGTAQCLTKLVYSWRVFTELGGMLKGKTVLSGLKEKKLKKVVEKASRKAARYLGINSLTAVNPIAIIVEAPVSEEIAYRQCLYGILVWLSTFGKSMVGRVRKTGRTVEGSEIPETTPDVWHRAPILMTSAIFALGHMKNHAQSIQRVLSRQESLLPHVFFLESSCALFLAVLQLLVAFLTSLNIYVPILQTNGLAGSIGGHVCWNFYCVFFLTFYLYLVLPVRFSWSLLRGMKQLRVKHLRNYDWSMETIVDELSKFIVRETDGGWRWLLATHNRLWRVLTGLPRQLKACWSRIVPSQKEEALAVLSE